MSSLLIVGNDKLGRRLINRLGPIHGINVVFDVSSDYSRIFRLFRRRVLTLPTILKMALSEMQRPDFIVSVRDTISCNHEMLQLIKKTNPEMIYLFRAGLIINQKVIEAGIPILNVHCASLPNYGGLGSVVRALRDGSYEQEATLHRVTTTIDEGEVISTMPYRLDPKVSYHDNEETAYEAGIELIIKMFTKDTK